MYCRNCGNPNPDSANHCIQCGSAMVVTVPPPPQPQPAPQHPQQQLTPQIEPVLTRRPSVPSHLAPAILTTLFCGFGMPFGIVAIVFAAQVAGKLASGDYSGALAASRQAKIWSWVAFGVGLGGILVWVTIMGGIFGAAMRGMH